MTDPQWILHGPGKHDRAVCDTAETWARLFVTMWEALARPPFAMEQTSTQAQARWNDANDFTRRNLDVALQLGFGNVPAELLTGVAHALAQAVEIKPDEMA